MFASLPGAELHYEAIGAGARVIVLHGGLGLDHGYLRPWLDPLGAERELVYVDLRGCGRSSRPASWDEVDHGVWSDDVEALRVQLGGGEIVLFGHSYGAFLALEHALRYGATLSGLVLCSVAPRIDYPDVIMANAHARGTPEQLAAVARLLSQPVKDDGELRALYERILPLYFHRFDPEIGARFIESIRFSAGAFDRSSGACLPGYDVLDRLGEISTPTLVLGGRHDWLTPPEQGAERVHAGIAQSELALFEESGHCPFIEESARFVERVRAWLAARA